MKTFFLVLTAALLAAAGGWLAARNSSPAPEAGGRKVAFYQSPMHPWIKSDQPGDCTICGMKLSPVYEGDRGFDTEANVISLSTNSINVLHVRTSEVRPRPLTRTLRVAGRVDDNDTRHAFVSAYVDGRIDKLFVNYVGAEVVAGEPLAEFYSPALTTAAQEYLGALRMKNAPGPAEEHARRNHDLLVRSAAERLSRLGLTEAQIGQLAENGEAGARIELKAPMTGTVVQRMVYEGMYVKEGDKLFEIADFATMWFVFDAYERDLGWLQPGQEVEVTTPAAPGKVFRAPIAFIDPNLSDATRSAKARVEIPNPLIEESGQRRRELRHRLFAEGKVRADAGTVLTIARAAVISAGGDPGAYVELSPGTFEHRALRLGRAGDEYWEVLDGVAEGEKVVTNGNLLIDAQAQLQRAGEGSAPAPEKPAAPAETPSAAPHAGHGAAAAAAPAERLAEPQMEAAREVLSAADKASRALAGDDLKQFNAESPALRLALEALKTALAHTGWSESAAKLASAAQWPEAKELTEARRAFFPFSQQAAAFAQTLRRQEPKFSGLKVFQCPMVKRDVSPGSRVGRWVQLSGPLLNPFFGAEMLECGTEVAP